MALGGEREREQRRGEGAASEGEERGDTGHRRGVARRGRGRARQAGREEVAGAGRPRASVLLAREEDDREEAVVGWAAAGLHSVGLRVGCQVS